MTKIQKIGSMIAAMALIFTGCKDKDKDPIVITFSPAVVEVVDGSSTTATISTGLEPFTVQSSDDSKASATVDGKTITIIGKAAGAVSITVTGKDNGKGILAVAVSQAAANTPKLNTAAIELEEDFSATVEITGGTAPFTVESANTSIATPVN